MKLPIVPPSGGLIRTMMSGDVARPQVSAPPREPPERGTANPRFQSWQSTICQPALPWSVVKLPSWFHLHQPSGQVPPCHIVLRWVWEILLNR